MTDTREVQLTKATSTILLLELAIDMNLSIEFLKEVVRVYKEYQLKQFLEVSSIPDAVKIDRRLGPDGLQELTPGRIRRLKL